MVQNTDMAEQTGEVVHTVTGPQGVHIEHARHALAFHEDIRLVEVAVHRDDRTGIGGRHELLDAVGDGARPQSMLGKHRRGRMRVVASPLGPGRVRGELQGAGGQRVQKRGQGGEDAGGAPLVHAAGEQARQGHTAPGRQQHEAVRVVAQDIGRGHARRAQHAMPIRESGRLAGPQHLGVSGRRVRVGHAHDRAPRGPISHHGGFNRRAQTPGEQRRSAGDRQRRQLGISGMPPDMNDRPLPAARRDPGQARRLGVGQARGRRTQILSAMRPVRGDHDGRVADGDPGARPMVDRVHLPAQQLLADRGQRSGQDGGGTRPGQEGDLLGLTCDLRSAHGSSVPHREASSATSATTFAAEG